jgi:hypothetical protein
MLRRPADSADRCTDIARQFPGAAASTLVRLLASQGAWRSLERRFLAGHGVLFSHLGAAKTHLLEEAGSSWTERERSWPVRPVLRV